MSSSWRSATERECAALHFNAHVHIRFEKKEEEETYCAARLGTSARVRLITFPSWPTKQVRTFKKNNPPAGSTMRWLPGSAFNGSPSLNHCTVGDGDPSALQFNVTGS